MKTFVNKANERNETQFRFLRHGVWNSVKIGLVFLGGQTLLIGENLRSAVVENNEIFTVIAKKIDYATICLHCH